MSPSLSSTSAFTFCNIYKCQLCICIGTLVSTFALGAKGCPSNGEVSVILVD